MYIYNMYAWEKTITDKKVKKGVVHTCSKNNLVENMNTNSPK